MVFSAPLFVPSSSSVGHENIQRQWPYRGLLSRLSQFCESSWHIHIRPAPCTSYDCACLAGFVLKPFRSQHRGKMRLILHMSILQCKWNNHAGYLGKQTDWNSVEEGEKVRDLKFWYEGHSCPNHSAHDPWKCWGKSRLARPERYDED